MPLAVGGVAFLYSSVGHGGATGYLALAALLGVAPAIARPGALWMNCAVACIAFLRFRQAGCFDGKVFIPFGMASIPCAWLGSQLHLDARVYAILLALALLTAGVLLCREKIDAKESLPPRPPGWPIALLTGAGLGFLAGLTGIGGGVFLTPLLLLLNWTPAKVAGGVSALFILVNSAAGLAGLGDAALVWQPVYFWTILLGITGAIIGTHFGIQCWRARGFARALAAVLWIAAGKLVLTGK